MLIEPLILATHRDPTTASEVPGIAIHTLHGPTAPVASFKRSNTAVRGLAVTPTHLFAAQSDKAVVNAYSRAKGALETTVPFPEKFTTIEASPGGEFLACGTEGGRILLWELASARFVSTPATHLQAITTLAFTRQHLLSGSADSNVFVWSLPLLLSINAAPEDRQPSRILDRHQSTITSVITGRASSGGPSDLAITASGDKTVIVWDYHSGTLLRTFILDAVPNCLAIDPADRAVYAGLADGGIQCLELLGAPDDGAGSELWKEEYRDVPVTLGESGRWQAAGQDTEITALAVAYEGHYVVSGNAKGEVCVWDVATGQLFRTITSMKAPITTLKLEHPTGFLSSSTTNTPTTSTPVLPRPRYDAVLAAASASTYTPRTYTLTTAFYGTLAEVHTSPLSAGFTASPVASFGPDKDMEAVLAGVKEMRSLGGGGTGGVRGGREGAAAEIRELEQENERLWRAYEKLRESSQRNYEMLAEKLLVDAGAGPAAAGSAGGDVVGT